MSKPEELGTAPMRLSTGYEVEVGLDERSTSGWRRHLARAILDERVLTEARQPEDRPAPGWHLDVIPPRGYRTRYFQGRNEGQVRRDACDYRRVLGSLSALRLVARPDNGEVAIIEGDHLCAWADARRTWYR